MGLSIRLRPEPGVLRVLATGEFFLVEAQQHFLEVMDAVDQSKATRVLVDGRHVTGNPETIERFLYGEFAASAVARYLTEDAARGAPQFAYVLHEPVLDPLRFGETVAVNRGMWLKVFDSLEDAQSWLGLNVTTDARDT